MKVLVTGASGFIGGPLCARLCGISHEVIACRRSRVEQPGFFMSARQNSGWEETGEAVFSRSALLRGIEKAAVGICIEK